VVGVQAVDSVVADPWWWIWAEDGGDLGAAE